MKQRDHDLALVHFVKFRNIIDQRSFTSEEKLSFCTGYLAALTDWGIFTRDEFQKLVNQTQIYIAGGEKNGRI